MKDFHPILLEPAVFKENAHLAGAVLFRSKTGMFRENNVQSSVLGNDGTLKSDSLSAFKNSIPTRACKVSIYTKQCVTKIPRTIPYYKKTI